MGDGTCRPGYLELLRQYLAERRGRALRRAPRATCEANPLRVLDCKRPGCRACHRGRRRASSTTCASPAPAHFARVRAGLDALGVPYAIDHRLVRGFDYYTRTTFEFASGALEAAQNGIGGGGRYDGLVEMLGGRPRPGIGFGIGDRAAAAGLRRRGGVPGRPAAARRLRGRRDRRRVGP